MEDQELNSEEQEVATQDTELNESSEHTEETQANEIDERDQEQEKNWRAMRQRQKEMEYALKQKDELIEKFLHTQQPNNQPQAVEEDPIDLDDYANYGGVQKVAARTVQPLEKKIADLETKIAQQEQQKLFSGLRSNYPDFDDVVNVETLEILEKKEPELAATIAEFKDPYKMGIQAYKYIKALNLAGELPSSRRKKEIDKRLEQNAKTVQSPLAYDKRPMAQAFKSTAADKKRLYEEMMYYASKANGL